MLCLTDFTESAYNGMEFGGRFTQQVKGAMCLLHVQPYQLPDILKESMDHSNPYVLEKSRIEQRLIEQCQYIENEYSVPCDYIIRGADLYQVVSNLTSQDEYDLVCMGTNGEDTLFQYFFGSHAYRALNNVHVPVFVIPESVEPVLPAKLYFASIYDENEVTVLHSLYQQFSPYAPDLHILHISHHEKTEQPPSSFQERITDQLQRTPEWHTLQGTDTAQKIHEFMQEREGWLALHPYPKSFPVHLFSQRISKYLTGVADYPLCVLPAA